MPLAPIARLVLVLIGVMLAACSAEPENKEHAECRRAWIKQFNVIFDDSVSSSEVRWFHDCMERLGYRRIYDSQLCKSLQASVKEPRCFKPIDEK